MIATLADLGPLYQDYAYAYPHKNAYRPFASPLRLNELWARENKDRVFLYLHIPFCEMRCGFCNLFTTANPGADRVSRYLSALDREMEAVRDEVGEVRPARMAIGGGTPTMLGAEALDLLLDKIAVCFNADPRCVPAAIETSPKTATQETIALLSSRGVERISIGAQTFIDAESRAMGRPQRAEEVSAALDTIRSHRFGRLNIDLIYGAANQTPASWRQSIRRALDWAPEEIYLYPLYVRPRTGLDGRTAVDDQHRRELYRAGRELLLSEGYEQVSMRAFHRSGVSPSGGGEYSCQEDGMLGLGAGARSYTAGAHYATDYAVSRPGVVGILDAYSTRGVDEFRHAYHGIEIGEAERMRRFVLKSILRRDGLDAARFEHLFGVSASTAFPALQTLVDLGLLTDGVVLAPTEAGLEHSDAIPPLFYSERVRRRLASAAIT